jgi:S1-C subfamily serine protease
MESVLAMHARAEKVYAPRTQEAPRHIRDIPGGRRGGCLHCHQVKEIVRADLMRKGQWTREMAWRYPLPENIGVELEVDRGNVIKHVQRKSAAAEAGLVAGDVVRQLNGVPVHSIADAQFALDIAPKSGSIDVVWQRGEKEQAGKLSLAEGWRRSDISWRPSMQRLVPAVRLYGLDLTAAEKKALGLPAERLAFRQKNTLHSQARAAGVQLGDIILGIDGKELEMEMTEFLRYVGRHYLVGDTVTINVLRDGKRLDLTMTLQP